MASKKTIKTKAIEDMKRLGVYKPEYDAIIDIYAGLCEQYAKALKDFESEGCAYETPTSTGGTKKSGTVSAMEALRKDILAYSDRLCLNPKSLETVTTEKGKTSRLAAVLHELGH